MTSRLINLLMKFSKIIFHKIKEPFSVLYHLLRYELFKSTPYHLKYFGFDLYYKKGDGAINHLMKGYAYEPEVIDTIIKNIDQNSTIIDVGTNIGLITLAILHQYPSTHFHCFEPSAYSYQTFRQTISKNNLGGNIKLIKKGLYSKSGRISFHTHGIPNALGDGIKDTKRAGISRKVTIEVTTLDNYVKKAKIRNIDLIKIDVEGAELFVLKGTSQTIKKFRPIIIFEAHPQNLKAYGLHIEDIFLYFQRMKYNVSALQRENFLAKPYEKN